MPRVFASCTFASVVVSSAAAQAPLARPPVIDVHSHSTITSPQALARLDSLNVRYFVLAGLASDLAKWAGVDTARYLPALVFPCDSGRAPITGRTCYEGGTDFPDTAWLRSAVREGRIRGFAEMLPQYLGIAPDDERLEPYWAMAEELDIPVGLHMGPGPPGAAYESSPVPFKSPRHLMAAGDPMLLEPVLLKHKRLRLYVMHAGWPRLDAMLALMYAHPGVYVDLAVLSSERVLPRAGYYRYLRDLVDAGFGKRIMFGSDFPEEVVAGVDAIMAADFLTAEQKADILCNNAARFLRRDPAVCR